MTNKTSFVDTRCYNENTIKTITDMPDDTTEVIAQQEITEAVRKKAEDIKQINAFIDRHKSLLLKLAK
jgi:mannitol-specific phosphotransferase system IIBC component